MCQKYDAHVQRRFTMGRRRSENVLQFKQVFLAKKQKGLSVREIAEQCHISTTYGYYLLQEIADENGMTRDEVLRQSTSTKVHKRPQATNTQGRESTTRRRSGSGRTQLNYLERVETKLVSKVIIVRNLIEEVNEMQKW